MCKCCFRVVFASVDNNESIFKVVCKHCGKEMTDRNRINELIGVYR